MKKVVVKLAVNSENSKEKAIRIVWNILGMLFNFIGIQKEPEKKEEPKKDDENWNSLPSTWTRFLEKMKKVVVKSAVNNEKSKKKAMKIVSNILGVDSITMDMKDKLTVIGDVDPVVIVQKLRKICFTEIVSVGPAKEEKKKEEPKKEEKDEEPKDPDDPENMGEPKNKKEEPKKKGKKEESKKPRGKYTGCRYYDPAGSTCRAYNPHITQYLRYLLNVIQCYIAELVRTVASLILLRALATRTILI